MKKRFLFTCIIFLMLAMSMNSVKAEVDKCDFDADGDVDAADLEVFSEKFGATIWFKDYDGDGFSDGSSLYALYGPRFYYSELELESITGDCDDEDADINPNADEMCYDDIDNDCDGYTDDSDPDCTIEPFCGDRSCEPAMGENCSTCPVDCPCGVGEICISGVCSAPVTCGDGSCEPAMGENCSTCPVDCPCGVGETCFSGVCIVPVTCGDGSCEPANGEDCSTCPVDCSCDKPQICVDGVCTGL